MRKVILIILGVLLLVISFFGAKKLMDSKPQPQTVEKKTVTNVFTEPVKNTNSLITISADGNLIAKNKVEVFSEVQGIFEGSARDFKPGVFYNKGETLLRINSDELRASLRAQKSTLYNQIVLLLPDLRLDYPESFPNWDAYVREFSMDKSLKPLPEPASEKEKLFITGRNILTAYYNVKNLEERLLKYKIQAPFSGVLTEALVNPGALVRSGQKLGEFIQPGVYELEVNLNASYADLLKVGKMVDLQNLDHTKSWTGRVVRVNGRLDQASQTVQVFIEVRGNELKEGMYLEAALQAKEEPNTFELNRKLLVDDTKLFVVQDSVLALTEVEPVFFKEKTVIVRGLADGTQVLSRVVPGAFPGMKVKIYTE